MAASVQSSFLTDWGEYPFWCIKSCTWFCYRYTVLCVMLQLARVAD